MKSTPFDLGREDYRNGEMRMSHYPERAAGFDAEHRETWLYRNNIWTKAALALGWEWSPAYAGYIRADYHPDGPANEFRSYPSELSAEDACFVDGIETIEEAEALLTSKREDAHASS